MRFVAIVLLLSAYSSQAQVLEASNYGRLANERNRFYLFGKPCTAPAVLKHLPVDAYEKYRQAGGYVSGQLHQACWISEGVNIRIIYADGDYSLHSAKLFRSSL